MRVLARASINTSLPISVSPQLQGWRASTVCATQARLPARRRGWAGLQSSHDSTASLLTLCITSSRKSSHSAQVKMALGCT